jgi:hypothetical protein
MPQGDIYEVAVEQLLHNNQIINVFHLRGEEPGATIELAANNVKTTITNYLRPAQGVDLHYVKVRARGLTPPYEQYEDDFASSVTGQRNELCAANQLAIVTSLKTGLAGRSRRGRHYLGGITMGDINDDGTIAPSRLAIVEGAWSNIMALFGLNAANPLFMIGCWSRLLAGTTPPYNTDAFRPYRTAIVRNVFATQRRRRLGVGS